MSSTTTIHGSATAVLPATPDAAFDRIIDIANLPAWNATMLGVVEQPDPLEVGKEWVVRFRVLGRTWNSRAVVTELDRVHRRFGHESGTDDGNPSRASWLWAVDPDPAGSRVTVTWELRPVTFWRRTLLGKIRARQLARSEVSASLAALAATL